MRRWIGVIVMLGAATLSAQARPAPKPATKAGDAAKKVEEKRNKFDYDRDGLLRSMQFERDALMDQMRFERDKIEFDSELLRGNMKFQLEDLQHGMKLGRDFDLKHDFDFKYDFDLKHDFDFDLKHDFDFAHDFNLNNDFNLKNDFNFKHDFDFKRDFDMMRDMKFDMKMDQMFDIKPGFEFGPKLGLLRGDGLTWKGMQGEDSFLRADARSWERRFPDDVADSLYRQARELLNRGEWRRAVTIFKDIAQRYPNSAYVPDAMYWHAFALYRIGGSGELRDAISVLDTQRTRFPGARTQADAATLATRIRGALAARGDATAAAQIARTASDSTQGCDQEELAVRVEALSALTQSDPDGAMPILQKVLARRDQCSIPLRRNAVFLIGAKRRGADASGTLVRIAKTDPSMEVRVAAIEWLSRMADESSLAALDELSRSDSETVQRAAARALVGSSAPGARKIVRTIVERNETPERVRLEALASFDKERSDAEDIAWMRALYGRTDNVRIKQRIVSTLSRIGGPEVDQWLLALARNNDESSETRGAALRRVAQTLPIADLSRLYDASAERSVREELLNALANRSEPEATDKLIEVVKTGTDPQLRRQAIASLTRKKDPRTTRLLMELLDK